MDLKYLVPRKYRFIVSILITIFLLGIYYFQLNPSANPANKYDPGLYQVTEFVDGDTIAVNMNGHSEKVRFIGVDTPETHKPNTPVQCYGTEAAAYTKRRIGLGKVKLVADPLTTDRDRYNRLLRYVYLEDGTDLDKAIISDGYGFYYPYFAFSKANEFDDAQASARSANKGLWSACEPTRTSKGGWVSNSQ